MNGTDVLAAALLVFAVGTFAALGVYLYGPWGAPLMLSVAFVGSLPGAILISRLQA